MDLVLVSRALIFFIIYLHFFYFFYFFYFILNISETSASAPRVPFFSSVTGKLIEGKIFPQYWWSNIREAVLFSQATSELISYFSELDQSK
jgi:hypothetical protein